MITDTNVIINGFQEFYYEILRQKEKALSFYLKAEIVQSNMRNNYSEDDITENNISAEYIPNDELEGTIVAIQKHLIASIDSVCEEISANSHLPERSVDDIRYIFAIFSDEIFLNLNWEGKERWKLYLLEKKLFQTEIAGDRFFEMAEETITITRDESMAFLYLMSLNLGFKGKFRDANREKEYISAYRSKLYALVHPMSSRLFYPGRTHLIETCYQYTCTIENEVELPNTKYWVRCITGIVGMYMVVSYIIWYNVTDDIRTLITQISTQMRQYPNSELNQSPWYLTGNDEQMFQRSAMMTRTS